MLTVAIRSGSPPTGDARGRAVNAWRDDRGRTFARGFARGTTFGIEWPDLAYFQFRTGSLDVETWLDQPARDDAARDAVVRVLQPMILQALGWQALHASGNLAGDGVVALCGRSGQGKSTLAVALSRAGAPQFADDAVLLELGPGGARALPLPFSPRLREPSREHLGLPDRTADRAASPLRLVIVLEQDAAVSQPELEPVAGVQAFTTLMTHAHCFDPAPGSGSASLVRDMMRLAADVPVLRLRFAPGLDRLDALTRLVLDAAAEQASASAPVPLETR